MEMFLFIKVAPQNTVVNTGVRRLKRLRPVRIVATARPSRGTVVQRGPLQFKTVAMAIARDEAGVAFEEAMGMLKSTWKSVRSMAGVMGL